MRQEKKEKDTPALRVAYTSIQELKKYTKKNQERRITTTNNRKGSIRTHNKTTKPRKEKRDEKKTQLIF